ncbi:MAG: sulfatase [Pirellulaceae bacterium]|nr:MAG: sulfatase [Pirellulaceae bacterium]
MSRLCFWQMLVCCVLACGYNAQAKAQEANSAALSQRPNILFLLADDLRPDGLHALGNPDLITPNLDRLVERGLVFRNAYCFGSNVGAVCLPSRTMLLSGKVYFHYRTDQLAGMASLPRSFREAGYYTYHHGKRGNTPLAIHKHFDESYYVKDDQERRCGEPSKEIVDQAIEFLHRRPKDRPFLMYLAFANPHDPRVANPQYMNQYDREKIRLPKNYMPVHPFNNGEMTVRDERLAAWPRTEEEIRKHLHDYYAVITAMDYHIGRLLAALDEQGLSKNTLIVFSSDHGLAVGSHGLMGKQSLYEHSMKSPLVFCGPGIAAGESDALVYLHDIYPTLCDWVGIPIPEGIDGRSAAGVLRGERRTHRNEILLCYKNVQRAVRQGSWKLIQYPQIHRTQLFDLSRDPNELQDLAGDPQYAERKAELLALMERLQREVGDQQPLFEKERLPEEWTPPAN